MYHNVSRCKLDTNFWEKCLCLFDTFISIKDTLLCFLYFYFYRHSVAAWWFLGFTERDIKLKVLVDVLKVCRCKAIHQVWKKLHLEPCNLTWIIFLKFFANYIINANSTVSNVEKKYSTVIKTKIVPQRKQM